MKIALIDSIVETAALRATQIDQVAIKKEAKKGRRENPLPSHGTLCAKILDAYVGAYDLVSLPIMQTEGTVRTKSHGDVQDLRKALELCMDLKVDVVSLSCVSSLLSDTDVLYDVAKKLSEQAVILAALDNKRYFTIPTGYPFVLGVQADWRKKTASGNLFYRKDDPLGAELYASCDPVVLHTLQVGMSNSFAVPVAAARINDLMNETGMSARQILQRIGKLIPAYLSDPVSEDLLYGEWRKRPYDITQIPLVAVSEEDGKADERCMKIIRYFYHRDRVQVTCLTDDQTEADVRFRSLQREKDPEKAIGFMRRHYKTDLILLAENTARGAISKVSNLDVRIECRNQVALLWYDDEQQEVPLSDLPEKLYQLLNGEEE